MAIIRYENQLIEASNQLEAQYKYHSCVQRIQAAFDQFNVKHPLTDDIIGKVLSNKGNLSCIKHIIRP